jgi:hypothetical protein
MPDVEGPLVEAAKRYLKEHYGEDTVSIRAGKVSTMSARMR